MCRPATAVARYLAVGGTVPPDLSQLAEQISTGESSPYLRALALESFLVEHYRFAADAPSGHAYPNLRFFLFDDPRAGGQRGTSEQFAAAFAALGRLMGLPTRVVVGFRTPAGGGPITGARRAGLAGGALHRRRLGGVRPDAGGGRAAASAGGRVPAQAAAAHDAARVGRTAGGSDVDRATADPHRGRPARRAGPGAALIAGGVGGGLLGAARASSLASWCCCGRVRTPSTARPGQPAAAGPRGVGRGARRAGPRRRAAAGRTWPRPRSPTTPRAVAATSGPATPTGRGPPRRRWTTSPPRSTRSGSPGVPRRAPTSLPRSAPGPRPASTDGRCGPAGRGGAVCCGASTPAPCCAADPQDPRAPKIPVIMM